MVTPGRTSGFSVLGSYKYSCSYLCIGFCMTYILISRFLLWFLILFYLHLPVFRYPFRFGFSGSRHSTSTSSSFCKQWPVGRFQYCIQVVGGGELHTVTQGREDMHRCVQLLSGTRGFEDHYTVVWNSWEGNVGMLEMVGKESCRLKFGMFWVLVSRMSYIWSKKFWSVISWELFGHEWGTYLPYYYVLNFSLFSCSAALFQTRHHSHPTGSSFEQHCIGRTLRTDLRAPVFEGG